ncbi:unnamed protein product [Vitrella brassicaformis CCMP3155]|uniref:Uncharacterized protein n=3 Tax=Vitrella brassicaformis TaxID=1169539 RepID=A0A0G4ECU9_VITBC|nr:unnamed protein product [Vitrella brassicaformis CCMP3155]|eukprot:CEL93151.1 unnamed protein product [Vitrella brassicaformis CCMP3155]
MHAKRALARIAEMDSGAQVRQGAPRDSRADDGLDMTAVQRARTLLIGRHTPIYEMDDAAHLVAKERRPRDSLRKAPSAAGAPSSSAMSGARIRMEGSVAAATRRRQTLNENKRRRRLKKMQSHMEKEEPRIAFGRSTSHLSRMGQTATNDTDKDHGSPSESVVEASIHPSDGTPDYWKVALQRVKEREAARQRERERSEIRAAEARQRRSKSLERATLLRQTVLERLRVEKEIQREHRLAAEASRLAQEDARRSMGEVWETKRKEAAKRTMEREARDRERVQREAEAARVNNQKRKVESARKAEAGRLEALQRVHVFEIRQMRRITSEEARKKREQETSTHLLELREEQARQAIQAAKQRIRLRRRQTTDAIPSKKDDGTPPQQPSPRLFPLRSFPLEARQLDSDNTSYNDNGENKFVLPPIEPVPKGESQSDVPSISSGELSGPLPVILDNTSGSAASSPRQRRAVPAVAQSDGGWRGSFSYAEAFRRTLRERKEKRQQYAQIHEHQQELKRRTSHKHINTHMRRVETLTHNNNNSSRNSRDISEEETTNDPLAAPAPILTRPTDGKSPCSPSPPPDSSSPPSLASSPSPVPQVGAFVGHIAGEDDHFFKNDGVAAPHLSTPSVKREWLAPKKAPQSSPACGTPNTNAGCRRRV